MKFVFFSRGFSKEALDKLTQLVGKGISDIKVCYITTPANVYPPDSPWLLEVEEDLVNYGFQVSRFDIEDAYNKGEDITQHISDKDIIFVSGGNTFYFMYWVEKTGLIEILRTFLESGGVYAGASAGATCQIADLTPIAELDNPDKAPARINSGMHLTDIIIIPHWGNPKYADKLEKVGKYYTDRGLEIHPLQDGQSLIVNGTDIDLVN